MSLTFPYTKIRKNFGRQPLFQMVQPHMLDSIATDVQEHNKYILRNPVCHETQTEICQSLHEINTYTAILKDSGINHKEGGWAKEINCDDEEQTSRYRRRIERDDEYIDAVLHLAPKFKHYIDQNNAIHLYDLYYQNMPTEVPVEKSSIRVNNIFKDPYSRPVASIGWTSAEDSKLVVSYCNKTFPTSAIKPEVNAIGYTWNLESPYYPADEFLPPVPCWQIVCSPNKPAIILGGLEDGRVCIFDLRAGKAPKAVSPEHLAHRDPVSALLFVSSRLNNEFFSGGTEGSCMWWDVRDLSQPIDIMVMSVFSPNRGQFYLGNAEPVSTLQFDRSFPTRFLCGTDTGYVVNVNRKGKNHNEMMSAIFKAHNGPVKALHRNPAILKMFLTCGDWRVNIFSDEITTSPIVPGQLQKSTINDATWAPQRASSYMTVSADGNFRYWDLLRKYHKPIGNLHLSNQPLLKLKIHDNGIFVAVGDKKGAVYLVSLSDVLVHSGDKDKQLMVQTYERETRRERILETRVKEIRVKMKADEEGVEAPPAEELIQDFSSVEAEYKKMVENAVRCIGMGLERHLSTGHVDGSKADIRKR